MFATPKRHILGRNGVFWRILRQSPSRALGCSELQEPKKKLTRFWCAKSRMRGNDTAGWIAANFCSCTCVGVHDVITCADLYYDRLRGLGVAGGKFWLSPLTCFVALTTVSHYRASVRYCVRVWCKLIQKWPRNTPNNNNQQHAVSSHSKDMQQDVYQH